MTTEKVTSKLGPIREGGLGAPPEDNVDTDSLVTDILPFVIDDFADRIVTPPTKIDGAGVTVSGTKGAMVWRQENTPIEVLPDPETAYWTTSLGALSSRISSYIGEWYDAWTTIPSWTCCTGITNAFSGWVYRELWQEIVIPAHPASMAGIVVQAKAWNGSALPIANGVEVLVSSTQPTRLGEGTPIGVIPHDNNYHDLFVPGASIPAEGSSLWVCVRPNWVTNFGAASCGWNWPYAATAGQLDCDGVAYQGLSGRTNAQVNTATAKWQTWTVTPNALGTTNSDPTNDEYEPRTWVDAGEEGSPTSYGVDSGLYVESTIAAGKGWYLPGPDEDDTVGDAPWSDSDGTRLEVDFAIDAVGLTGQVGTRELEMVVVGDGWRQSVKAHLGDPGYAAGVSADGGSVPRSFVAKAIVADTVHTLAMDTRSGKLRAKLWASTGGITEPALWDVEVAIGETIDEGDRFELWLRVGNVTGAQRITVSKLRAYPTAGDGDIVVAELIGIANGVSSRFPTAHQFQRGSLYLVANGGVGRAILIDPAEAEFVADTEPTIGSILRVRYAKGEELLVDEDEDDVSEVID